MFIQDSRVYTLLKRCNTDQNWNQRNTGQSSEIWKICCEISRIFYTAHPTDVHCNWFCWDPEAFQPMNLETQLADPKIFRAWNFQSLTFKPKFWSFQIPKPLNFLIFIIKPWDFKSLFIGKIFKPLTQLQAKPLT